MASLRALQSGQLAGKLLPRETVQAVWGLAFVTLRDRLLGVADRLSERGANRTAEELRVILDTEMREILEAVSRGEF